MTLDTKCTRNYIIPYRHRYHSSSWCTIKVLSIQHRGEQPEKQTLFVLQHF